jgi:phosphoglycolate phosphatase
MKTIIWDWNGTLLDDVNVCIECINAMLGARSLPLIESVEAYRKTFGFPVQGYYERCGFDFSVTPFPVLAQEYIELYRVASASCTLSPGAIEALEAARKKGFRQIILSASKKDALLEQVRAFPLSGYFSEILGIDDVYAASKLDLAIRWLRGQSEDRKEITMIGDSLHDLDVASAIGVRCVLYAKGHQAITTAHRERNAVVDDLRDSLSLL